MDAHLELTPGSETDILTFDAWTMVKQLMVAIGANVTAYQLADVCMSIDAGRSASSDGRTWQFEDLWLFFGLATKRLPGLFTFDDTAFGKSVAACIVQSGVLHTLRPWTCATIARVLRPLSPRRVVFTLTLIFTQDAENQASARVRALESRLATARCSHK